MERSQRAKGFEGHGGNRKIALADFPVGEQSQNSKGSINWENTDSRFKDDDHYGLRNTEYENHFLASMSWHLGNLKRESGCLSDTDLQGIVENIFHDVVWMPLGSVSDRALDNDPSNTNRVHVHVRISAEQAGAIRGLVFDGQKRDERNGPEDTVGKRKLRIRIFQEYLSKCKADFAEADPSDVTLIRKLWSISGEVLKLPEHVCNLIYFFTAAFDCADQFDRMQSILGTEVQSRTLLRAKIKSFTKKRRKRPREKKTCMGDR